MGLDIKREQLNAESATRIAVSVVMTRDHHGLEVYLVRRGDSAPFLSGFHVFPGGFVEREDYEVGDGDREIAHRWAGAREVYEETGILLATRDDSCTTHQGASGLDLSSSSKLCATNFDAESFQDLGQWVSPSYLINDFVTRFFRVHVDQRVVPNLTNQSEVDNGQWISPTIALRQWKNGGMLFAPPTLHILRSLVTNPNADTDIMPETATIRSPTYSPIRADVLLVPLQTPTLPPATHTNCYVLGKNDLWIVEPASAKADELECLFSYLDDAVKNGARVRGVVLTHHHHDHIGGVVQTLSRYGVECWAHCETARRVPFEVHRHLQAGDTLPHTDARSWRVLYTPGHAPGHICLYSQDDRTMVVGDMVAGVGSILIEPSEGNMADYLQSLESMAALNPSCLLPSHGPAIGGAVFKLRAYIAHRLQREKRVMDSLANREQTLYDLVQKVYADVAPGLRNGPQGGIAGLSLRAHLDKLESEGRVIQAEPDTWRLPAGE